MKSVTKARKLVDALRDELAVSEERIRDHTYLRALEEKQISMENLKDFAGEQYNIIQSDLRSEALMVSRFGATQNGTFLREIMNGEAQALSLLLDFAKALALMRTNCESMSRSLERRLIPLVSPLLRSTGQKRK